MARRDPAKRRRSALSITAIRSDQRLNVQDLARVLARMVLAPDPGRSPPGPDPSRESSSPPGAPRR
jgi:hypothetical protein